MPKVKSPVSSAEIAEYFGVEECLFEKIAVLLADFHALGSLPKDLVALLIPHLTGENLSVVELGCGKGAVATAVADTFKCRVLGVDMLPEFVEAAEQNAAELGVSDLCRFSCGDIREIAKTERGHDAVLLVSVGEVFGDLEETVRHLRDMVRPGGIIVIDDGYAKEGETVAFPGYEHVLTEDEAKAQLTRFGDEIVAELTIPTETMKAMNARYNRRIQNRVRDIERGTPELADALGRYVDRQLEECHIVEEQMVCVTWVIRTRRA